MARAQILVAARDPGFAGGLAANLRSLGYTVSGVVSSSEEVLEKAEETRPDLVLLDVGLLQDGKKGSAAGQLRKRLPNLVYLVGEEDSQTFKQAKITHSFDYLRRGYDSRELETIIDMALYRRKLEEAAKGEGEERKQTRQKWQQRWEKQAAELREITAKLKREGERHQRLEEILQAERQRLYAVLDTLPAYVLLLTIDYSMPFANREFVKRFGAPEGRKCYNFLFGRTSPCPDCQTYKVLDTGAPHEWEWTGPDGRNYQIHDFPFPDVDGSPLILEMGVDVTVLREKEAQIRRANRALKTLSAGNKAVVRAGSEAELLRNACRAITEEGGYRLAWIGYAEDDPEKTVRPLAQAGYEEGYLETLKITWADQERGRGPTGTAIRTGQPVLARNILTDPHFAPWRREAIKRGYASSLVLPLLMEGRAIGTLNIYAGEADAFDDEEVKLLSDLAGNISFGIMALRGREERRRMAAALQRSYEEMEARVQDRTRELAQANAALQKEVAERLWSEKKLKESEERYRSLFQNNHAVMLLIDPETGEIVDANPAACSFYGYRKKELTARKITDIRLDTPEQVFRNMQQVKARKESHFFFKHRLPNGEIRDVEVYSSPIQAHGRELLYSIIHDNTARKEAEDTLHASRDFLEVANRHSQMAPLLQDFVGEIKAHTGCEAVAIRILHEQGQIPYEAAAGFPEEFLASESPLSIMSDQCLCINVIKGATDPCSPLYTPGASCYINRFSQFLAAVPPELRGETRNICHQFGYESVALIPIIFGGDILGLIHLADRRENLVPLSLVERLERIALTLGTAINRVRAEEGLRRALEDSRQRQAEISALLQATRAVLEAGTFEEISRSIYDSCKDLIGASSGYIALLTADGQENEVLFLDTGRLDCRVDPSLPMPVRGLRAEAYHTGKTVYDNDYPRSDHAQFLPPGHVRLKNVLFAPLVAKGRTVGLLGLGNKPGGYTENDARLTAGFAELAAVALANQRAEEERERLIRELETERGRLQAIIASAPEAIVVADENGRILLTNPAADRLYAHPAGGVEDAPSCALFQLCHADGTTCSPGNQPLLRSAQAGETHRNLEMVIAWPGGQRRDLLVNTAPLMDQHGSSSGAVGLFQDITNLKEAEKERQRLMQELEEQRMLLEAVLHQMPAGVAVMSATGKLILANEQVEQIFRQPVPPDIGVKQLTKFKIFHADGRPYRLEEYPLARALRQGETIIDEDIDFQRGDGSRGTFRTSAAPIRDRHGDIMAGVVTFYDITERKEADLELARKKAEFEAIFNSISDAIIFTDTQRRVVLANPAVTAIFGYEQEELYGKNTEFLYARKAYYKEMGRQQYHLGALPDRQIFQMTYRRKDKTAFIGETLGTQVRDGEGQVLGFVGIHRDITQRKETEEKIRKLNVELGSRIREVSERTRQLEAANKELEAFSYSVSHDLRTPLRAIEGFARMLMEDHRQRLDGEGWRLLNVIRSNTHIMGKLIDDLLALSRLGRLEIRAQEFDLEGLVTLVFGELQAQAPARKMQLILNPLPPAYGDRTLINQVVINLLDNALKFTQPKEEAIIEVSGWTEGKEDIYFVKDNGVGFDMRYVDKIFGVFQRLHRGEDFAGTGVGLAIIQRIISRHGGRVWATGKVGQGAVFYFALPRKGAGN